MYILGIFWICSCWLLSKLLAKFVQREIDSRILSTDRRAWGPPMDPKFGDRFRGFSHAKTLARRSFISQFGYKMPCAFVFVYVNDFPKIRKHLWVIIISVLYLKWPSKIFWYFFFQFGWFLDTLLAIVNRVLISFKIGYCPRVIFDMKK